ncbi:unnamed protein product [Heterobilharzia americana]|nr:unnamed protein product [Heterobilharzia americana]
MDKPYDEMVEVLESEDIATPRLQQSLAENHDRPQDSRADDSREINISRAKTNDWNEVEHAKVSGLGSSDDDDDDEEEEDDEDEDDDDDDDKNPNIPDEIEGAYNPGDYEHLAVSSEIKEMFQYIQRYTPQTVELETKLKPFIPDYMPAVGDIDAFLKIPRPDGKPDYLALSKQTTLKQVAVRSIENPQQQTKAVDNWIKSITDLHRSKPPPTVQYVRNMPEISQLMAEWPTTFEECLQNVQLPSSQLDCSLKDYVDIICALLDIPVCNNRIHSLHLLFSLYLEFKNSQHFRQKDSITT